MNMYKLIKANPPNLEATSILDYTKLIEELLQDFYTIIPKMCVPMTLFKKLEKQSLENSDIMAEYLAEHRKTLI